MGLYDRHYYREGGGRGGQFASGILGFLNQSFAIGTYLGIRVRVHITFFLFIGIYLLTDLLGGGRVLDTLQWTTLLFGSVLLHEFGHCLACRRVGGTANDILMWPLGGLAMCAPPNTPRAHFWTVVWGPMVNVIICSLIYAALAVLHSTATPLPLNPFTPVYPATFNAIERFAAWGFFVNYWLLLFNLCLVFYPFDGGRLVQIALWVRMGYGRSMLVATTVGMAGAVLVGLVGLALAKTMLFLIGIFGFYTCYRQKQGIRYAEPAGGGGFDPAYQAAYDKQTQQEDRKFEKAQREQQKRLKREQEAEVELNRVLDKVNVQGIQSLSRQEKNTLQQATDRQRQV